MSSQTINRPVQANEPSKAKSSFQVVCSVCHKTISYSGKDGEVFTVICDKCEGIR